MQPVEELRLGATHLPLHLYLPHTLRRGQVAEVMDPEAGFLLRDSVVLAVEVLECCPWCAASTAGTRALRKAGLLSRWSAAMW